MEKKGVASFTRLFNLDIVLDIGPADYALSRRAEYELIITDSVEILKMLYYAYPNKDLDTPFKNYW
jgi:hypothetical protein